MSQRGRTHFYTRILFAEGQWPLKYFHHLSFIEQAFLFKNFIMWHAPEFSMCCYSYSLNKLCWKGHCLPTDLCKSRKNPVAAGIVQEENKQEGGRRQWEEENGKLLGGQAEHRVSQPFCITADRG